MHIIRLGSLLINNYEIIPQVLTFEMNMPSSVGSRGCPDLLFVPPLMLIPSASPGFLKTSIS
jgi:hypothetical protein